MSETIIVEIRAGGGWNEYQRIENAEIVAYAVTPAQVAEYVRTHPSPLERLFDTPSVFRVIHRVEQEVARFSVQPSSPASPSAHSQQEIAT